MYAVHQPNKIVVSIDSNNNKSNINNYSIQLIQMSIWVHRLISATRYSTKTVT